MDGNFEDTTTIEEKNEGGNNYQHLQDLASNSRMVIAVYDFRSFKSDFISDNIDEILGLSVEEHRVKGGSLFLDNIAAEHSDFGTVLSRIMQECFLSLGSTKVKISFISCGMKYNHPTKGVIRLLNKQYLNELDENFRPLKSIFTTQDVTHFIKDDFYWIYVDCELDRKSTSHYRSETGEKYPSNIISPREKEILLLISQGLETDEIAGKLFISRNTVNNHRQNMLNRLGVRDTTALIHLSKLCGLI